jgi:hypothetical protein
MHVDTGEIITEELLNTLPPEEQEKHVPLTLRQAEQYGKLQPSERMGQYRIDQDRHKQKQLEKRRAANKRNKQSRRHK